MSNKLCHACRKIFHLDVEQCATDSSYQKDWKIHHVSPGDLYVSSRTCRICRGLWIKSRPYLLDRAQTQAGQEYNESNSTYYLIESVRDQVETTPRDSDDLDPPHQTLFSSKTWLTLSFKWRPLDYQKPVDTYYLMASYKVSQLVGRYEPSTTIDSASTWTLCGEWINDCLRNHKARCNSSTRETRFYPTRLLKLTTQGSKVRVRLILCKDEPPEGDYMTLSHCWGESQVLKLTHQNMESFRTDIDMLELPALYQDAARIVHRLGIQFLWIDSLCIIQDEEQLIGSDWMNESQVMGAIYENSLCNIAASEASNSCEMLLHDREVIDLRPYEVEVGTGPSDQKPFYLYPTWVLQGRQDEPLSKRGWVLQEELLPPRALVFTRQQVRWECRTKEACESFPGGVPSTTCGFDLYQTATPQRPISQLKQWVASQSPVYFQYHRSSDASLSPWLSFWLSWKCIVEDYSRRSITNSSDKLVAIAGLAAKLDHKTEPSSRYVAGMWNVDITIIYELGWKVGKQSNGQPACRPKVYRAPTWAWPSMDGAIQYQYKTDHTMVGDFQLAYVVNSHVATLDGSFVGPIRSGFIDIEGPLLEMGIWGCYGPEDSVETASKMLYRLSMVSRYIDQEIWGLALRKIETGPDKGCYRRVGTFSHVDDIGDMSGYDLLYDAPKQIVRIV